MARSLPAAAIGAYRFAAFFLARFANGEGALPALIAAHRFLAASAIAFRPAALRVRLPFAGALGAAGCDRFDASRAAAAFFRPDPGGRPRRLSGPARASIALDRRSRSAISKATMCSV